MAKFLDLEGLNYFWAKIKSWVQERFAYKSDLNQKQNTLVSGQNIKTINNQNILGPGNIEIQGGSSAVNSVNGKTGNVILSANDVGAVPAERTINGKALSSNITLNASDVNALPSSTTIPTKVSDLNNDQNFTSVSIDRKVSTGTNIADITIDGTTTQLYAPTSGGGGGGEDNVIESISVNGTAQTVTNKNVDITVPTKVSDLDNDSGFTANTGTITSIKMNGSTVSSSGEADLGTVITSHQDISGKEDKTNKITSFQSTPDDTHYPSEKLVKDSLDVKQDTIDSSHKLSADYIQDGITNKVINVKPDWNAASGADAEILNKPTIPAAGIPSGGNASQVLKKVSSADYDVTWANQSETLPSAYCTTSGSTSAKKANCSLYVTQANQYLQVLIGSANTYQGELTLNINSAGAKPIYINGTVSSSINYTLPNGTYFVFYDGTNYYFRTDGKIQGPDGILYNKPSTGIPASDLANGVIPTVPVISTNIATDKTSTTKTASPSAVYNEVHPTVATSQPQGGMLPNVMYKLGTLSANTTFTFSEPTDNTIVNHYFLTFDMGATVYTITFVALSSWGSTITWQSSLPASLTANKHYEVSIIDGIGIFMEV